MFTPNKIMRLAYSKDKTRQASNNPEMISHRGYQTKCPHSISKRACEELAGSNESPSSRPSPLNPAKGQMGEIEISK
jgi:hypothetical protein